MQGKIIKNLIFSIITISIFFGSLELGQRVRYAVRYHDKCWLYYGTDLFRNTYDPTSRYPQADAELKKSIANKSIVSAMDDIKVFHYKYESKLDGKGQVLYRKHAPGDYILTKDAKMHINSLGLRGPELLNPKRKVRILMLGGSSTLGAYNNDDKTYPYLTEKILRETYGKDVEVVNGGVGGANARELYHLLNDNISKIDPDIVMVYSGYNNWNARSREGSGLRSFIFHIKEFFLERSLLFCTINEKMCLLRKRSCEEVWFNPGVAQSILANEKLWSDFKAYLGGICEVARRNNIRVILMTQPLYLVEKKPKSFWEDKRQWGKHYDRSNSIIRETAVLYGDQCIDIAAAVDSKYGDYKEGLFMDIVHLTDKGNEVLAEYIAKELDGTVNTLPASGVKQQ